MKLRTHKHLRFIQAHQYRLRWAAWDRFIEGILGLATPRVVPDAEETSPETMKAYNNMLLGELVEPVPEPTGITYLNEKDQAVSVPLDSDAGRHAVTMFTDFQNYKPNKKKYVVIEKTSGEIVGDFDELTDAETMIDKAKRAKKKALMLL